MYTFFSCSEFFAQNSFRAANTAAQWSSKDNQSSKQFVIQTTHLRIWSFGWCWNKTKAYVYNRYLQISKQNQSKSVAIFQFSYDDVCCSISHLWDVWKTSMRKKFALNAGSMGRWCTRARSTLLRDRHAGVRWNHMVIENIALCRMSSHTAINKWHTRIPASVVILSVLWWFIKHPIFGKCRPILFRSKRD